MHVVRLSVFLLAKDDELSVYDRSFLQSQSSRKLVRRPALKKPGYTVSWAFYIIIEGYCMARLCCNSLISCRLSRYAASYAGKG